MRNLVEEEPLCTECGEGPLTFQKDDNCRMRDASRGTLTCDSCEHTEKAMVFWRISYTGLTRELSEGERLMREAREARKDARLEANKEYAATRKLPDGWRFVFERETPQGARLVVRISNEVYERDVLEREHVKDFERKYRDIEVEFMGMVTNSGARRYQTVRTKVPPRGPERVTTTTIEIDERLPSREVG